MWFSVSEYIATLITPYHQPAAPVAPQPQPYLAPPLGEPWLGQCRRKGPPLRAMALTACEAPPMWVGLAQSYQTRSPSLVCRNCSVGNAHVHTYIYTPMDSAYQAGPWDPPASHHAKPQQLERLKPPYISKRKNSRRAEGRRDIGMGEKKEGKKYIFVFTWMSASASIPPAAVIEKVRRGKSGTPSGQGGERDACSEVFLSKAENDVATSSGCTILLSLFLSCCKHLVHWSKQVMLSLDSRKLIYWNRSCLSLLSVFQLMCKSTQGYDMKMWLVLFRSAATCKYTPPPPIMVPQQI